MIYTQATYWRALALTPEERARLFGNGTLQLRPPEPPVGSPRQEAIARVTDAVAEYRALANPQRGDLARIARDHGLPPNSLSARLKKEEAVERERQRAQPVKRELMLVCEVPRREAGPKNSENFGPNGRRA